MPTKPIPDYSYLSVFADCPRKGHYMYNQGLVPAEPNLPMHAGSAGHAGIHTLFQSGWDVEQACGAVRAAWGDFKTPPGSKWAHLTPGHLEVVVRNFADDFKPADFQVVDAGHWKLFQEVAQTFQWDGLEVGGKPDMPPILYGGQNAYIVDIKFTSAWLTDWWAQKFRISHQLRIYQAMLQHLTGVEIAGALVLGVYMGDKAADPPEKWKNRQSARSRLFGPYHFTPAHLAETRTWIRDVQAQITLFQGLKSWPQNTRSCQGCDYVALCEASPQIRDRIASMQYATRSFEGMMLASGAA